MNLLDRYVIRAVLGGVALMLVVLLTLGAMFALVAATARVTAIDSPVERALAIGAELILGIVLLLGTVWVATHLAVRIFHVQDRVPGEPLG